VPANVPAIELVFSSNGYEENEARLVRVDGDRSEAVPITVERPGPSNSLYGLLRPDAPLVEGARYTVELVDCDETTPSVVAEFEVGPEAPLPTTLGAAVATAPAEQDFTLLAGGTLSCNRAVSGWVVDAHVKLDASTIPWAGLLRYAATIDGEPWFDESYGRLGGSPPPGAGGTRIYRLCDAISLDHGYQFTPGSHEIALQAVLPGTDVALVTQTFDVELYCEGEEPALPSSGGCGVATAPNGGNFIALLFGLALAAMLGRTIARERRERERHD
jgi:hypothetical protein